jgi:hypothetical protein
VLYIKKIFFKVFQPNWWKVIARKDIVQAHVKDWSDATRPHFPYGRRWIAKPVGEG